MKEKILNLVPAFTARGGITNYYEVLKHEFPAEIEYFERGARTWPVRKGTIPELIRAYKDYRLFKKRIQKGDVKLVQSTTSLGISTTIRDGLFLRYARKKGIKTIAFFRGWDDKAEIKTQKYFLNLFRYFFFHADALIVLSKRVETTLKNWGYQGKIIKETTLVAKQLIAGINKEDVIKKYNELGKSKTINLVFLSRVEKRKGIYELLEAFKKIRTNNHFNFTLTICGDGFELESIQEMIQTENIPDVRLEGFVSGEEKKRAFQNAHIFVFPSYGEGMPNAVLEAMGFGLPVITTPVGGLIDFFEEGRNGYFTGINKPDELAEKIETIIADEKLLTDMAVTNYLLAKQRFSSDKVAERILKIFHEVIVN